MQIYSNKLFKNPEKVITAFDKNSFISAFEEIEKLKDKFYLVGYIRYEAKDIFLGKNIKSDLPLLYFEAYKDYEEFKIPNNPTNVFLFPKPTLDFTKYSKAINEIKEQISMGNTYEVNYTFDFDIKTEYSSSEIFNYLLSIQKTEYNAFLSNNYEEILSFSPELFFRKIGNKITTKPMKGTIKRGSNEKEDKKNIEFLKNDIKNKAENVMIVDLLRNDLGKIAKTSSVKVPKLFEIETHKTLHQMTSTIEAELDKNITLYKIFEAIFPCGSITGAPKISTMSIIDKIETGKRNVYCGAIGIIHKNNCEFSVPIRILQKQKFSDTYKYRAGGAIVWDSTADNEWEEVFVKTAFLSCNTSDWKLIETIKVENLKPLYFEKHLERLKNSSKELGFIYNKKIENIIPEKDGILRILHSKNGDYEFKINPYSECKSEKVTLSEQVVSSKDVFLFHKTTFRPYYEKSFEKIKQGKIYDEIFFNEKGELTEGARSNILIDLDGILYTPPVPCGLLNGVLRSIMLKEGKCFERVLDKSDLKKANHIYCINSVRGIREVYL